MNKTVTINLAGIFFHIDEDAYARLQHYLDAIKRSFTDAQGRDEIIADIEARIAELFSEKIRNERQVITNLEVDEVIAIMGQPEDYHLGDDPEEENYSSSSTQPRSKRLFRDPSKSYVGGVSSGLGHYLNTDPIWIRILWISLTIFSGGTFIFLYILLWIIVPEAKTTADFLAMKGEAVTISNIEKKIKEGLSDVADTIKDVDYKKYGSQVKSGSAAFFDSLATFVLSVLKIFVKFIGALLVFFSGTALISLLIAFFAVGIFGFFSNPALEYFDAVNYPGTPIWLLSLIIFLVAGIPQFFLLLLGLKVLMPSLKSIGTPAKLGLLAVWIFAIVGGVVLGINQATQEGFDAQVIQEETVLDLTASDTLIVRMASNNRYIKSTHHRNNFKIKRNEKDQKVLVFQDIEILIKENTLDSLVKLTIRKNAEGNSYENAKQRAEAIKYNYSQKGNTLLLDAYALTDFKNKYNDQEVEVHLELPEGMIIYSDDNTSSFHNSWKYDEFLTIDEREGHYLQLKNNTLECLDCSEMDENDADSIKIKISEEDRTKLKIDEDGIILNGEQTKLNIDENGVEIKNENIDIKIDENGVNIAKQNNYNQ